MKITREVFHESIDKFLSILEEEGIDSLGDVEKAVGKKFHFSGPLQEYIYIEERPSNLDSTAYTLGYTKVGLGIPLELKINTQLDYSQIIVKTFFPLQGYNPFMRDMYGNVAQSRFFQSKINLSLLLQELERLKSE